VRQRTVLVLRFYEDLTEVETARLMGCSQNTVKTQTRRALERLRVLAPDLVLLREGDSRTPRRPGSRAGGDPMTGPVLDRDRLDAAADRMLAGTRIDVAAVRAASETRTRRARRRRLGAVAATCLVAAAVVLIVAMGGVRPIAAPTVPARPPAGPGSLPAVVRVAPPWTPSATERPLTRVAYAVRDARAEPQGDGTVWLVGADGGEYRRLPSRDSREIAVSADGARVAWAEPVPEVLPWETSRDVVKVLDVRTGVVRDVEPLVAGRGLAVEGMAFAPAGDELVVWGAGSRTSSAGDRQLHVREVSLGSDAGRVREVCACPAPPDELRITWAVGSQADGRHRHPLPGQRRAGSRRLDGHTGSPELPDRGLRPVPGGPRAAVTRPCR
jgi:hypothetical protein